MNAAVRHTAKWMLARGLLGIGGWQIALGWWARHHATVVLTYHRVLDKWDHALDYSQPGMVVTASTFERQLQFLQRHFEIVALGELSGAGPAGRPRCVITFDDGWRDNHDVALPILRRHGLPATIFLATDFIGNDRVFWHTELISLLLHGDLTGLGADAGVLSDFPEPVRACLLDCANRTPLPYAEDVDTVVETVKTHCEEDDIDRLLTRLARVAHRTRPLVRGRRLFLDWDQVAVMAAAGFEIGSHGCSHRILTRLSLTEANEELVRSKSVIEQRLSRVVSHFAFPNEDASDELVGLAARAGYRTVCLGIDAAVAQLTALRRVTMHEGSGAVGAAQDDAVLSLALLRGPKSRLA
jgi:peptidoglycan/xylan/chitin deacetylase (PgdA/CDA1 family)